VLTDEGVGTLIRSRERSVAAHGFFLDGGMLGVPLMARSSEPGCSISTTRCTTRIRHIFRISSLDDVYWRIIWLSRETPIGLRCIYWRRYGATSARADATHGVDPNTSCTRPRFPDLPAWSAPPGCCARLLTRCRGASWSFPTHRCIIPVRS
jgi:hypothetical protein